MRFIKAFFHFIYRIFVTIIKMILFVIGLAITVTIAITILMYTTTTSVSPQEYHGSHDAIMILGCSVLPDGSPSSMLQDRLDAGYEVFTRYNSTILVTGDEEKYYNEVECMKKYLVDKGVPESKIMEDGNGYSTYDSIYRAKKNYGFDHLVIVSQKYHLPRCLYLAEKFDIDAIGVYARDVEYNGQLYRSLRELLSRDKAFYYGLVKPEV